MQDILLQSIPQTIHTKYTMEEDETESMRVPQNVDFGQYGPTTSLDERPMKTQENEDAYYNSLGN